MRKLLYAAVVISALALLGMGCSNDQTLTGSSTETSARAVPLASSLATADGMTATLHLYLTQASGHEVYLHRVTADWDEMAVTWGTFAGAYDPAVAASFTSDVTGWHTVDVSGLVDGWMNGDFDNFGIMMDQGEMSWPRTIITSKDNPTEQPYLEICYDGEGCDEVIALGDAYIYEWYPDANTGAKVELDMGWYDETDLEKQALIRFELPETPDEPGCTATIGYWKNHAGYGHQGDEVSQYLPLWLGDADGAASLLVSDAATAVKVLSQNVYGRANNGITKLYAQMLAAKLNIAAGADDYDVADAMAGADSFLAMYDWTSWSDLDYGQKMQVLSWKDTFDKYNNGIIGPGHCDGDDVHNGCERCNQHRHHKRGHNGGGGNGGHGGGCK